MSGTSILAIPFCQVKPGDIFAHGRDYVRAITNVQTKLMGSHGEKFWTMEAVSVMERNQKYTIKKLASSKVVVHATKKTPYRVMAVDVLSADDDEGKEVMVAELVLYRLSGDYDQLDLTVSGKNDPFNLQPQLPKLFEKAQDACDDDAMLKITLTTFAIDANRKHTFVESAQVTVPT